MSYRNTNITSVLLFIHHKGVKLAASSDLSSQKFEFLFEFRVCWTDLEKLTDGLQRVLHKEQVLCERRGEVTGKDRKMEWTRARRATRSVR